MSRVKDIILKPIGSSDANRFVKKHHYSGKVVNNSKIHFGCFLDGRLGGVMSFGTPMDKRKVLGLVVGTQWDEMVELNRMAFADFLPKFSESRCIAISAKLLKKQYPRLKWILSYSDATKCGDGTIYRASGFILTNVGVNKTMIEMPWGERVANLSLSNADSRTRTDHAKRLGITLGGGSSIKPFLDAGCKIADGFQLRYIKLLDKDLILTCPTLPYSKIDEMGAGMYKGIKRVKKDDSEFRSESRQCDSDPPAPSLK